MEERHSGVMTTMVGSNLYTTAQILAVVAAAIEEVAGLTMEVVEEGRITATTKVLLRSRMGHPPVGFLPPLVQQDSGMVLLHHQEQLASVWVYLPRLQRIMEVVVHTMATVVAIRDNKVAIRDNKVAIGMAVISPGNRLGVTMARHLVVAMVMGATSAIDE
jgi:hypothetical protein